MNAASTEYSVIKLAAGSYTLDAPLNMLPRRIYDFYGCLITQGAGVNMPALLAGDNWLNNSAVNQAPFTVLGGVFHGNKAANTGTHGLVAMGWRTTVRDSQFEATPGDGILLTVFTQNDTEYVGAGTMQEPHFDHVYIYQPDGNCFRVRDNGSAKITDGKILGGSEFWAVNNGTAVDIDQSAGWQIDGLHIFGEYQYGLSMFNCFETVVKGCYLEGITGGSFRVGMWLRATGALSVTGNVTTTTATTGTTFHYLLNTANAANVGTIAVSGNAARGVSAHGTMYRIDPDAGTLRVSYPYGSSHTGLATFIDSAVSGGGSLTILNAPPP